MATDVQGVSTLVAFLGCPLSYKYCINNSCHDEHKAVHANYTPEELIEVLKKDETII